MDNQFKSFQNSQYFSVIPDYIQQDTVDQESTCFHVFQGQNLQQSLLGAVTTSAKLKSSLISQKSGLITKCQEPKDKEYEQFVKYIPPQLNQSTGNSQSDVSFLTKTCKIGKMPSVFQQKSEYSQKSNWLNQSELRCTLQHGKQPTSTICRTKNGELQFANGYAFELKNINKIKVAFEGYQKCIWFTYRNCQVELKFRVYIQNDVKDDIYILFSKIIIQKLQLLRVPIDMKTIVDPDADQFMMVGQIYKMSQVIKKWNKRKLVLTDRIESFKGDKCTFSMSGIRQIWTRFDIHNQCLVIKMKHFKGKTELAIPIMNYSVKLAKHNWLYRIYKLVSITIA